MLRVFLSHVIALIKAQVQNRVGKEKINSSTNWYINIGIPLEAQKEDWRASLYRKVLNIAVLFEAKFHDQTSISLFELDAFCAKHENASSDQLNILPEIYAEVLLYQQNPNTPEGFYTVIDIGGGTVDIATFLKTFDASEPRIDCLAQRVRPYGFDAIAESVVQTHHNSLIELARTFMMRTDIPLNAKYDDALWRMIPDGIDCDLFINARGECRELVGGCLQEARNKRNDILLRNAKDRIPMYVFMMGGANSVAFYGSTIDLMLKTQESSGYHSIEKADVLDYVGRNTHFEIRNDQRLIISQMLAQPYEMIPEIENMPWDLAEHNVVSRGRDWGDYKDLQNELYPV